MTGAIEGDDLGYERPNDQRVQAGVGNGCDEGGQVRGAPLCVAR